MSSYNKQQIINNHTENMILNLRELDVWKKSRYLILALHQIAQHALNKDNKQLADQIQSAGIAFPNHIAGILEQRNKTERSSLVRMAFQATDELELSLENAYHDGLLLESDYLKIVAQVTDVKVSFQSYVKNLKNKGII